MDELTDDQEHRQTKPKQNETVPVAAVHLRRASEERGMQEKRRRQPTVGGAKVGLTVGGARVGLTVG